MDTTSPDPALPLLSHHTLPHLPELRVDTGMFALRFQPACSMMKCSSTCCKGGVWADLAERENILHHADIVREFMDPHQDRDSTKWFDTEEVEDMDFPSRKAVGTQVRAYGCVFLNGEGRCVLQKADIAHNYALKLKPFYCTAFPITIEDSVLVFDDYMEDHEKQCCSPAPAGTGEQDVFDVLAYEMEYVVGAEGYRELKEMAGKK